MSGIQKRVLILFIILIALLLGMGFYYGPSLFEKEQVEIPPDVLEPLDASIREEPVTVSVKNLESVIELLRSLTREGDLIAVSQKAFQLLGISAATETVTLSPLELDLLITRLEALTPQGIRPLQISPEVYESLLPVPEEPVEPPTELEMLISDVEPSGE